MSRILGEHGSFGLVAFNFTNTFVYRLEHNKNIFAYSFCILATYYKPFCYAYSCPCISAWFFCIKIELQLVVIFMHKNDYIFITFNRILL